MDESPPLPATSLAQAIGSKHEPLTLPKDCYTSFVLPKGKPTCGLVWMHGLGDDESGWADALEESFDLKGLKALDASGTSGSCRFMLPRAPRRRVTCNGGATMPSWFDFLKLPLSATDADNYGCSLEEAIASCGRVHAAIDMLVSEGIPAERIMVGGFSQGGAMAMLSTLTYPQRLAGVIVFSGICFFGEHVAKLAASPQCHDLKVFWGHGSKDTILHPSLQDFGVDILKRAGIAAVAKKYEVDHGNTQQEMDDAAAFFASAIAAKV
ncbi:unnamed protein product [Symbiodinium natans]|uniref:Phospholipase/carboxylesterase/thioesterase domain-containing protein n=1 Tax=Symbiodinium natans TaxID=878477 RepID=A0A812N7W4_9DINO|nr:unnamed protein product [Symbiodinium natans]